MWFVKLLREVYHSISGRPFTYALDMIGQPETETLPEKGRSLMKHAYLELERGHLEQARDLMERARVAFSRVDDYAGICEALVGLGGLLARSGDKLGALAVLKRCAGLCGSHRLPELRLKAAQVMGEVFLEQESPMLALACFRDTLMEFEETETFKHLPEFYFLRDLFMKVLLLKLEQGRAQVKRGQVGEAVRYYLEALNLARDPLFLPLDEKVLPYHLNLYENLITVELNNIYTVPASSSMGHDPNRGSLAQVA